MVDPLNIGPMQAARLLPAIKQNKDAARSRFMEIETHNCANFRRFARVTHFAERAQSNSVTNLERVHITACNQYLYLFWHTENIAATNLSGRTRSSELGCQAAPESTVLVSPLDWLR